MEFIKVRELLEEKARKIGLNLPPVFAKLLKPGTGLESNILEGYIPYYQEGKIIVNMRAFVDRTDMELRAEAERQVSLCQLYLSEKAIDAIPAFPDRAISSNMMIILFRSYLEYITGLRQIENFGQRSYDIAHGYLFKERTDHSISRIRLTEGEEKLNWIAALYVQQMQAILFDNKPDYIPPVIHSLTSPFEPCYLEVFNSKLNLWEKGVVLCLMFNTHFDHVDMARSYDSGGICIKRNVFTGFDRDYVSEDIINEQGFRFAKELCEEMFQWYFANAKSSRKGFAPPSQN